MMLIFLSVCCPLMNESTKFEYQEDLEKVAISLLWSTNRKMPLGKTEANVEILYGSIHHLTKVSPKT